VVTRVRRPPVASKPITWRLDRLFPGIIGRLGPKNIMGPETRHAPNPAVTFVRQSSNLLLGVSSLKNLPVLNSRIPPLSMTDSRSRPTKSRAPPRPSPRPSDHSHRLQSNTSITKQINTHLVYNHPDKDDAVIFFSFFSFCCQGLLASDSLARCSATIAPCLLGQEIWSSITLTLHFLWS
jgi:hypothetical protein